MPDQADNVARAEQVRQWIIEHYGENFYEDHCGSVTDEFCAAYAEAEVKALRAERERLRDILRSFAVVSMVCLSGAEHNNPPSMQCRLCEAWGPSVNHKSECPLALPSPPVAEREKERK